MDKIQENVDVKDYCTLKVGGSFRYFVEVDNIYVLLEIYEFAKSKNLPVLVLGGGSNIVFSDGIIDVVAIKNKISGFKVVNEKDTNVDIKVGAGEIWDSIVANTVTMGLSGLESLSAIPGTVGGTPVQNVGAYGSEVKDTILEVEAFDTKENIMTTLSNFDCRFSYRNSIFKNEAKGRYIITAVTYSLSKALPVVPNYPPVLKYFEEKKNSSPTLSDIRDAIIIIRREKLPDPSITPNVGSFFKNAIVANEISDKIKKEYPSAIFFKVDERCTKIPAGWLIENSGLKGKSFGHVSIYENNALVLVTDGEATEEDIVNARDEIIKIVHEKFGIKLEQEPENI